LRVEANLSPNGASLSEISVVQSNPYGAIQSQQQLRELLLGKDDLVHALTNRAKTAEDQLAEIFGTTAPDIKKDTAVQALLDKAKAAQELAAALSDRVKAAEEHTAKLEDSLLALSGNYRIYCQSRERLAAEIADVVAEAERAWDVVMASPPEFRPTKFWTFFYSVNMAQLKLSGISNFKLSINQNYHNFMPLSWEDPKLAPLLATFAHDLSLDDLTALIENPVISALAPLFAEGSPPLFASSSDLILYRTLVTLCWRKARAVDKFDLCARLTEPELGNPIRVTVDGRLVSQDLATSIAEINCWLPWLSETVQGPIEVLEIGGGYGRLAHVLFQTRPVRRYLIVDIPPALQICAGYLSRLMPNLRIFNARPFERWEDVSQEINASDLVLLFPHQLQLVPNGYLDASLAVSSLHEMHLSQANSYLAEMGRVSRRLIYSKQYWRYINPHDDIVLEQGQYHYPPGFSSVYLQDDTLNPIFFEQVLMRSVPSGEAPETNLSA
jgi:putative sugar O-methyltransferase